MQIKTPHLVTGLITGATLIAFGAAAWFIHPDAPPPIGFYLLVGCVGLVLATSTGTASIIQSINKRQTQALLRVHRDALATVLAGHEEQLRVLSKEADERADAIINAFTDALQKPGITLDDIHRLVVDAGSVLGRSLQVTEVLADATRALVAAAPNQNGSTGTTGPQSPLTSV